jgi:hypothetical protein
MAEQRNRESPTERRAWVRIRTSQEVSCRCIGASASGQPGTGLRGKLRDVSRGGLAVLLSRNFAPGILLTIELSKTNPRGAPSFPVQVVHVTPAGKSHWILGCAFIYPPSKYELLTLVGH